MTPPPPPHLLFTLPHIAVMTTGEDVLSGTWSLPYCPIRLWIFLFKQKSRLPRNITFQSNWSTSVQPVVRKSPFQNGQWWSGGSIYATTQIHNMSHKQGTSPLHWQHEQHRATRHSTQRDIAARERAYFLWGSSPCLEWRVYTHNASRGRRGGSPGQNAPPLGSPGSTGRGPPWCRTGKRRSPCYLGRDENKDGWNIAPVAKTTRVCYRSLNGPFICFMTLAFKQVQTEKIKSCSQQIESKRVCCLDSFYHLVYVH